MISQHPHLNPGRSLPKGTAWFIRLIAYLCLACWSLPTWAAGRLGQEAGLDDLMSALNQLVRDVDVAAQVVVKPTGKERNLSLPGTPFLLKDPQVTSSNTVRFAALDITIFLSSARPPDGLEALVKEFASPYAKELSIKWRQLPASFAHARQKLQGVNRIEAKFEDKEHAWEKPLAEALGLMSQLGVKVDRSLALFDGLPLRQVLLFSLSLAVFATLVLVAVLYLWFKSHKDLLLSINNGFKQLSSAYESGASPAMAAPSGQQTSRTPSYAGGQTGDNDQRFGSMSDDSLLALMSDCYWTANDAYGAFLWRRIPMARKPKLIEKMPELSDYGSFVNRLAEEDLGLEQDPSYLSPLPLWRVDTNDLTELVKQHAFLLKRLSPMRASSLRLRPSEYLALAGAATTTASRQDIPSSLANMRSALRELRQPLMITLKSLEDEAEILALKDQPLTLMEDVPSLGWLLKISETEAKELLRPFSARDLASAWIAPAAVLDALRPLVGDKKFELMSSFMERFKPSRSSPAFAAIHTATMDILRSRSQQSLGQEEAEEATPATEGSYDAA